MTKDDIMALERQAEPTCPECKAAVLYECVACSSNNYPPQRKPLTNHELEICIGYRLPDAGFDAIRELIEAAHGIKETP